MKIAMLRALRALSIVWVLSGAVFFVLTAYDVGRSLTRIQALSIFTLEAACVFAFFMSFSAHGDPTREVPRGDQPNAERVLANEERRAAAVSYCKSETKFYDTTSRYNFQLWRFCLTSTIVLGAVGTALSSVDSSSKILLVVRSIAVAGTTVFAGLISSYRLQQESVRQSACADSLRGELIKFATASEPYTTDDSTARFTGRVREIISLENQTYVSSTQNKQPGT